MPALFFFIKDTLERINDVMNVINDCDEHFSDYPS